MLGITLSQKSTALRKKNAEARILRHAAEMKVVLEMLKGSHGESHHLKTLENGKTAVNLKYVKSRFPKFSEATIQRALRTLVSDEIVIVEQTKGFGTCTKWYSLK